jgi:hypothetical protein
MRLDEYGGMGFAWKSAPNLRASWDRAERFAKVLTTTTTYEVREVELGAWLILHRDDVVELIRVFLPAGSNETRLIDQVSAHLNKIVDMGFLRKLRGQDQTFEVRRIIKAFVDAQWLAEFDRRLAEYRGQAAGPGSAEDG